MKTITLIACDKCSTDIFMRTVEYDIIEKLQSELKEFEKDATKALQGTGWYLDSSDDLPEFWD